jgi:hypothetical protein
MLVRSLTKNLRRYKIVSKNLPEISEARDRDPGQNSVQDIPEENMARVLICYDIGCCYFLVGEGNHE